MRNRPLIQNTTRSISKGDFCPYREEFQITTEAQKRIPCSMHPEKTTYSLLYYSYPMALEIHRAIITYFLCL